MNNGGYSSPGVETDASLPHRGASNMKLMNATNRGPIRPSKTNRESQVSTALSKITKVQPITTITKSKHSPDQSISYDPNNTSIPISQTT